MVLPFTLFLQARNRPLCITGECCTIQSQLANQSAKNTSHIIKGYNQYNVSSLLLKLKGWSVCPLVMRYVSLALRRRLEWTRSHEINENFTSGVLMEMSWYRGRFDGGCQLVYGVRCSDGVRWRHVVRIWYNPYFSEKKNEITFNSV